MPRPADSAPPSRLRRRAGVLLSGAVLAAGLLGACASTPSSDELVDALERSGLSTAEATCAAEALYRNLDDDQIGAIAERGPSAVIDDLQDPDEPIDVARREIAACRTTHESTTTTVAESEPTLPIDGEASTTSTVPDAGDGATSTTLPADGEGSTTLGPGTSLPKEPLGTPTTVRPAD